MVNNVSTRNHHGRIAPTPHTQSTSIAIEGNMPREEPTAVDVNLDTIATEITLHATSNNIGTGRNMQTTDHAVDHRRRRHRHRATETAIRNGNHTTRRAVVAETIDITGLVQRVVMVTETGRLVVVIVVDQGHLPPEPGVVVRKVIVSSGAVVPVNWTGTRIETRVRSVRRQMSNRVRFERKNRRARTASPSRVNEINRLHRRRPAPVIRLILRQRKRSARRRRRKTSPSPRIADDDDDVET